MTTDIGLYHGMCAMLIGTIGAGALWQLQRSLRLTRPHFEILPVVVVAVVVRLAAIAMPVVFGIADRVRSTDDADFLTRAVDLSNRSLLDAAWLRGVVDELPLLPWALIVRIFGDPGDVSLRVFQVSLETGALILFAAIAYDLGGRTAGLICAWMIALEPSNAFFATLLHDEAIATVSAGTFLLGLSRYWRRGADRPAVAMIAVGLALAVGTRPYVAVALAAALVASVVHRALLSRMAPRRTAVLMLSVLILATPPAFAAVTVVYPDGLRALQAYHDYEYELANLDLDDVNVTTTYGLIETLVQRSGDLVARPFPWQLENANQQLGAAATLIWYALLVGALVLWVRFRRLLPKGWLALAYGFVFQAAAFALTLVNAALGFRHRIHLFMIVACLLAVLLALRQNERSGGPQSTLGS